MCRDIRAFVDLRDSSIIKFREGMTGYAKRNPGSLFQLHKENAVDADFIMGIDKLKKSLFGNDDNDNNIDEENYIYNKYKKQ